MRHHNLLSRAPMMGPLSSGKIWAAHGAYGGGFSPSALFADGEVGFYGSSLDPDDGNVWQDTARTTPATVGDPVGSWLLKTAGADIYATASTDALRPTLREDSNGRFYLETSSHCLVTPSINFTGTDEATLVASVYKASDASGGTIAELTTGTSNGRFVMNAPASSVGLRYAFAGRGSSSVSATSTSANYDAPNAAVVSGRVKISTDQTALWVNGNPVASSSSDLGTGTFSNAPVYIGARDGASLFLNGRIYGLIVIGRFLTDAERVSAEEYVAGLGASGTASLTETYLLPDSTLASNPGGGFTITGLARASDGTWIAANDGRTDVADLTYTPGLVILSSDFSTILAELDMSAAYATPESIQGVAYDASDDTIWFSDKANGLVRHCEMDGTLIGSPISPGISPNGLAYDPVADELYIATDADATVLIHDADTGAYLRSIEAPSANIDMMFIDGSRLFLTTGANGTDGTVIVCSKITGAEISRITALEDAQAIEGVYISGNSMWIANDGAFHTEATPSISAVFKYRFAL